MAAPATVDVDYPPVDGTQPCAAENPELFFPRTSRDAQFAYPRAKAVCETCPFRRPCLAYALAHNVTGIWAGTSHEERHALRKAHGIKAQPVELGHRAVLRDDIAAKDRGGLPPLTSPSPSA